MSVPKGTPVVRGLVRDPVGLHDILVELNAGDVAAIKAGASSLNVSLATFLKLSIRAGVALMAPEQSALARRLETMVYELAEAGVPRSRVRRS